MSTYSAITAQLQIESSATLPNIVGIDEAYLAVVKAKNFVENLLLNEDGSLRLQVFEENVRSYLGSENPVNQSIAETLQSADQATRFPVLNNGITIVSPDVLLQGTNLHLSNFQIVNGCQTSNVLYENRHLLQNNTMLNLKIVETSNEDVFSDLVRATNSQTKVEETQFLSLRPFVKKVEAYFATYEDHDTALYFERRERQYVGRGIPALRTFNVHKSVKAVSAMFCERPDMSFKYPKRMYEELSGKIFAENNKEIMFYAACLALYRYQILVANSTIPQNKGRLKWHVLLLVRYIIGGKDVPAFNSKAMEKMCEKIVNQLAQHSEEATEIFREAVSAIDRVENITDDRLKRQGILDEFRDQLEALDT